MGRLNGSGGSTSRGSSGGRIGNWSGETLSFLPYLDKPKKPSQSDIVVQNFLANNGSKGNSKLVTGFDNPQGTTRQYAPGYTPKYADYYQQAYGQNAQYESPIDAPIKFAKETGMNLLDALTDAQRAAAPAKGDIKNGRLTDEFLARTGTEAYQYKPRSAAQQVAEATRAGTLPSRARSGRRR